VHPMDRGATSEAIAYYRDEYGGVIPSSEPVERFAASTWDPAHAGPQRRMIERTLPLARDWRILDDGCGVGTFVLHMRELGFSVDGVEVDPRLTRIARLRARDAGLPDSIFLHSDDGRIPAPDGSYDCVLSYMVAEHVRDAAAYVAEALRVLRPGGAFHLVTVNYALGWEYHYRLWLPLFSRTLSKLVLRWKGRKTSFLDGLNLVNPRALDAVFRSLRKAGLIPLLVRADLYNPLVFIVRKEASPPIGNAP